MPHKHTRKQDVDDKNFNLAPSSRAKSLPTFSKRSKSSVNGPSVADKRKKTFQQRQTITDGYGADDTPRAFARLLQRHSGMKQRSGLDDGERAQPTKKRKLANEASPDDNSLEADAVDHVPLQLLPGESLSAFSARVNQALPLSNLSNKGKKVEGVKERQTRTEKRLHRMYAEWRVEEAKRKERLQEAQEQEEEVADGLAAEYGGQDVSLPSWRKTKRRRLIGEVSDDEHENPWAILKSKREAGQQQQQQQQQQGVRGSGRIKGINDVVQAPPALNVIPREKFKLRNGAKVDVANVPGHAGSLKRREELSGARKEVIERYRAMMKNNS